jgi:hypothetical protein
MAETSAEALEPFRRYLEVLARLLTTPAGRLTDLLPDPREATRPAKTPAAVPVANSDALVTPPAS